VKKEEGNAGDFMAVCLCMLALTVVMLSYVDSVRLVGEKTQISQLARKYILKMETEGRLTDADRTTLCQELESLGVTGVDLGGSTLEKAGYGEAIVLVIRGRLRDGYEFEEKRVSVAKH
jgi:hypothetical protein